METLGGILAILALASIVCAIIGLFNPQLFIPKKLTINKPRLTVFVFFVGLFFILATIGGILLPSETDSEGNPVTENSDVTEAKTTERGRVREKKKAERDYYVVADPLELIQMMKAPKPKSSKKVRQPDAIVVYDSLWTSILVHHFDSLYNRLMDCDKNEAVATDRRSRHEAIKTFIYDEWWEVMEKYDTARTQLPICRKEYEKACRKYDKEYARFLKYGDENEVSIKLWAESEAERILRQVLRDPKSLEIISVSTPKKVSNGYRCIVKYRAKNGFGGYNVEQLNMLMAYDEENSLYRCIDAK